MNAAGSESDLSSAKTQEAEALLRYEEMLKLELAPPRRENLAADAIQVRKDP
jgi:hypothetical protein